MNVLGLAFRIITSDAKDVTNLPRVKITRDVGGWAVGEVGYLDQDGRKVWNADGTDYAYATVGYHCVVTNEPVTLGSKTLSEARAERGL